MPAPPPPRDDDDRPATRRDLAQVREVLEANVRAAIADLRAEFATHRAETAEEFGKVDQRVSALTVALSEGLAAVTGKVSDQTRLLIVAMVVMFGATIGVILRTGA